MRLFDCIGNSFCTFTGNLGYVIVDHSLKMMWYVWTKHKTEFFIKLIKKQNNYWNTGF